MTDKLDDPAAAPGPPPSPGDVSGLDALCANITGGTIAFEVDPIERAQIDARYAQQIAPLDNFLFWRAAQTGTYRPKQGLWLPQRRAVAFGHAYLAACDAGATGGQAAIVKMPTGTGKTAVIATLACASRRVKRTLVLTPREGLVDQMRDDLAFRFWGKAFGAYYDGTEVRYAADHDELRSFVRRVRNGRAAPVRTLEASQYARIWRDRDLPRQILVGTFNALHRNLGIEPPPHHSTFGREAPDPATILTQLPGGSVEAFRALLKSVDLVIVDEGHYEPAYAWSQAVRELGRPTIVFSATPYRNDYKYFKIDGDFVFNLPWDEAVTNRLIRRVTVEKPIVPPPAKAVGTANTPETRAIEFVNTFKATLAALPPGKKVIVHAATFRSLAYLQRAFFDLAGEAAVLVHDIALLEKAAGVGLEEIGTADEKSLKERRFKRVSHAVEFMKTHPTRILLHQYKLLEGIDDASVVEIWLLDPFGSARALVQQIGRATRLPDLKDKEGQVATIRGSSTPIDKFVGAPTVHDQLVERWTNYLAYEDYAKSEIKMAFRAETQLLASVKRAAPAVQYIAGEFRGGHLLDQNPTMAAFMLPRRASVYLHDGGFTIEDKVLNELAEAFRVAMMLEERFDIVEVPAPEGDEASYADVRLIRYLSWSNSPYLLRHHIPEWRLGAAAIARAGRYIFLLDTEGIPIDKARLKLRIPSNAELRRLFPATEPDAKRRTRIVETGASGLDVGERGLRAINLRRHALDESYFDLAEASQVPTSISGIAPHEGGSTRRRLTLATAGVADASHGYLPVDRWVDWTRSIARVMSDPAGVPHAYFERFAHEIPPPDEDDGAPISILLDLWGLVDEISADEAETKGWNEDELKKLLDHDMCAEITEEIDEHGNVHRFFPYGPYKLAIEYAYHAGVPPRGRYKITGDLLDQAVTGPETVEDDGVEQHPDERQFGKKLPTSLMRSLNQKQSFRVIPADGSGVYALGHFYKPELSASLLSILEKSNGLAAVVSEKGNTRVTDPTKWGTMTLFGLVYGWIDGTAAQTNEEFEQDIRACNLVICDDSNDETVDFYAVDDKARRVILVHAKAGTAKNPEAAAGNLQEVTRQAQASLGFAGSAGMRLTMPASWSKPWSVTMKDAGKHVETRNRTLRGPASIIDAHAQLANALADRSYRKEVAVMTRGLLSIDAANKAFATQATMDLQFLYYLASARTAFDRAGVRYRIICNP